MDTIEYLLQKAKNGDERAFDELFSLLQADLKKMSAGLYIAGADKNDILQECRIGLWKAIKDYNAEPGMTFKNFAVNVCCRRHIYTTVSHANRKKYIIHNSASSLDTPISIDDEESTLSDFVQDKNIDIFNELSTKIDFEQCKDLLYQRLTKLEISILELYLQGAAYKEIANNLNIKTKAVDNALMRVRHKASEISPDLD